MNSLQSKILVARIPVFQKIATTCMGAFFVIYVLTDSNAEVRSRGKDSVNLVCLGQEKIFRKHE